MNPVDYFDPAKDTVKRALGQRLIPRISGWAKEETRDAVYGRLITKRSTYKYTYGDRLYTISPITDFARDTFKGYELTVNPGATARLAWVHTRGIEWEVKDTNSKPMLFGSAEDAALSANAHAEKYGVF